jgi:citrate lyase subunit beta/citryl-CoA lyase
MRSWLFVPGDSEKKLAKSGTAGADVLILDLEDAVAPDRKPVARTLVAEHLCAHPGDRGSALWVRINSLDTPDALPDLAAAMAGRPDGIVLPKAEGPEDVGLLDRYLTAFEVQNDIAQGATAILPIATETPGSVFRLGEYRACSPRLSGLSWGGEDLATATGTRENRGEKGDWSEPYRLVRSLCLFGAAAAGVAAIDAVFTNFRDEDGLRRSCEAARRDGFAGMLAIHPAQIPVINTAFAPTREELTRAQRIVDLFAEKPDAGALALDGEMVDAPHLARARAMLGLEKA